MLRHLLRLLVPSITLLGVTSTLAAPCDPIPALQLTPFDAERLAALEQSRSAALAQIASEGDAEARRTVAAFFDEGLAPVDDLPPGDYRCRTVKLGGPFGPFTAYSFFACRVAETPEGLKLDKLTGSQRFSGYLAAVDGGLVFRGASQYSDELPRRYGDDPERDEVACLGRLEGDGGSWLLEFPRPRVESLHNVIELQPLAAAR